MKVFIMDTFIKVIKIIIIIKTLIIIMNFIIIKMVITYYS